MLNSFYIENHVRKALEEDIGFGDITTDYLTNEEDQMSCELNSRVEGILCGKAVFEMVFKICPLSVDSLDTKEWSLMPLTFSVGWS